MSAIASGLLEIVYHEDAPKEIAGWAKNTPWCGAWEAYDPRRMISDFLSGAYSYILYPAEVGRYFLVDSAGEGIEIEGLQCRKVRFCSHRDKAKLLSVDRIKLTCVKCGRVQELFVG